MAKLETRSQVKFAKILADGNLHIQAEDPKAEGVVARKVEKSDGTEVVYMEHVYNSISGKITSLEVKDGDFGRNLYIAIDNEIVVSAGTSNSFGLELLKKIPNIDVAKEVTIAPYSFTDENGRSVKGVNVYQDGAKVFSFFQEGTGKDTKNLHGYPDVDEAKKPEKTEKTKWSKFWQKYFDDVEEFLVEYVQKNHTIAYEEAKDEPAEIKVEDVPFE